jgi:hypothetical protein
MYCCGVQRHFKNSLPLLTYCCVVLYCNYIGVMWTAEPRGCATRVPAVRRHALSSSQLAASCWSAVAYYQTAASHLQQDTHPYSHHCHNFRSHSASVCFTFQLQKLIPFNKLNWLCSMNTVYTLSLIVTGLTNWFLDRERAICTSCCDWEMNVTVRDWCHLFCDVTLC